MRKKISGEELITHILDGETDFDGIEVEGYNLNDDGRWKKLYGFLIDREGSPHDLSFEGAWLKKIVALGMPLRNTSFRGADIIDSNIRYANLSRANLNKAYLKGVDASGCDFRQASLDGTTLWNVYLTGAIIKDPFSYAQHMEYAILKNVYADLRTQEAINELRAKADKYQEFGGSY